MQALLRPLVVLLIVILVVACGSSGATETGVQVVVEATEKPGAMDSGMKMSLLELANNRDEWFLTSDITTEALEGLYDSWSIICRQETSLVDYKSAVYEGVRPWLLGILNIKLRDAQKADRYYRVLDWNSPWAYVEQTWKLGDRIVFGPEKQLYLIESGVWRYHDC